MNILGIQGFYYNHAAALLLDGRLKYMLEEEKLQRQKASREGFPYLAIAEALSVAGITPDEINELAYPVSPWRYSLNLLRELPHAVAEQAAGAIRFSSPSAPASISPAPDRILTSLRFTPPFLRSLIRNHLGYGAVFSKLPAVAFVPHHAAHAAAAFYPSGMEQAAILIADGMGELESTSLWQGRGLDLQHLESIGFPNSLGEFYAAFTEFCGFRSYSQEGKLMGLAAYGAPDAAIARKLKKVIQVDEHGYRVNPAYTIRGRHGNSPFYSQAFVELFGRPRRPDGEITDYHKALAFAAQQSLEDAVLVMVRKVVKLTGMRTLCFSGGVAMNCKLNGRILSSGLIDRLFVLPASNDAGAALGAALWRARIHGLDPRMHLKHAYYGAEYGEREIEQSLQRIKAPYRRIGEGRYDEIASLLTEGKSLGLFTGRSEFGARALGARSILADPRGHAMQHIINERVKGREVWRPFAPAILEGYEQEYFEAGEPSYFMMKTFRVRAEKRGVIPAVVHVDGTSRPQSVARENNPVCHELLQAFHRLTGIPLLLNTSFNYRDEPIVARPLDAIRCFYATGLDALLIGPFLLRKS